LGSRVALPAHAELDVASRTQSIETFFESEYPRLDALYMDIHDMDIHAYPNKAR
jgi:hypothetical protein